MEDSLPKKILMTADTLGGVWNYSLDLSKEFVKHGVEVHLATMGKAPGNHQLRHVEHIKNLFIYPSQYQLEWMDEPWQDVEKAGNWLLELNDNIRPDIIHLNNYAHGNLSWGVPVIMVAHSCVLSWWKAVKKTNAPEKYNPYRNIVKEGINAADLLIAPTESMLNSIRLYYQPSTVMTVIPNGKDPSDFHIKEKKPYVFSMGRIWDESKNIASLVEIAKDLPWPVLVAGDHVHPSGQKNFELQDVQFLGKVNLKLIAEYLAEAGIYVLPARYEPFGLSILEAAFSGCALVIGNIDSLKENWKDAALFVDTDDKEDLKSKLLLLTKDDQLRQAYAEKAYQRSLQFTSKKMAESYLSYYKQLLKKQVVGLSP